MNIFAENMLLAVVFAVISLFLPCDSQGEGTIFSSVSVNEAYVLLQNRTDIQLIDVRTVEEFESVFIEGATLIPVSFLPNLQGTLNKKTPILVYCAVGGRSYVAGKYLQSAGFSEVYNMSGGIREWSERGFPVKFGR